jgi:outer membrane protein assembly factor BamA
MRVGLILIVAAGMIGLWGAEPSGGTATAKERPPVVRAVEFKNFHGVSVKEIQNRLNDRDIQLVERPYDSSYVETAQEIVEQLLAEKGQSGIHVRPTVTRIPPHAVRLTFTAASE